MKLIEQAVKDYWGDRCEDFNHECVCCQAWAEIDIYKKAFEKQKEYSSKLLTLYRLVGPIGRKVIETMSRNNITRIGITWGEDVWRLSGEERSALVLKILQMNEDLK